MPQGAWGGRKRATGNQFDEFKEANTVRGHSLKTPLHQSDDIKNSDPGAEKGSYRPGEELQQGQTSPRNKGRGQEGPSSKKRDVQGSDQRQEGARRIRGWKSLQVNNWQQELGKAQRLLTKREKHESIARAHIYGADEDGTDSGEKL